MVNAPDNNAGAADPPPPLPPPPGVDAVDNDDHEEDRTEHVGIVIASDNPPPRPPHDQDGRVTVQAAASRSALGLNQGEGGNNFQAAASPNAIGLNHRAGGANFEPAGSVADADVEGYDENLGRRTEASGLRRGGSIGVSWNSSREAGARDRNDKRPGELPHHPPKRQRNDPRSNEGSVTVSEGGVARVAAAQPTGPDKATGRDDIVPRVVAGLTVHGDDAPPVDAEGGDDGVTPSLDDGGVDRGEVTAPSPGTGDGLGVRRENFLRKLEGMSDSQSFLMSLLPLSVEAVQGQTLDLQAARKRILDLEGALRQKDDQLKASQIQVEKLKVALIETESAHVAALYQKEEEHLAAIRHVEAQRDAARAQRDALQVELDAVLQNHEDDLAARRPLDM